ncbi:MAG: outer membrane beta-barrel protein [Bacteroidia bacterium]|nr:outer membrane beta-barrel protein [Bacteroidia bacterium]
MLNQKILASILILLPLLWGQDPEGEHHDDTPEESTWQQPTPSPRRTRWGWQYYQELGYNQFLGIPDTLRNSVEGLGSIKINLSWLPHLRIGSALYIGAGFGVAIRETRFEEPISLYKTASNTFGYTLDSLPPSVQAKSKFQLGYLRIPLEMGFLYKKFNFAVFGFGEALLWAKHKRKYREGSDLTRAVVYGNHNFRTNPLQYGVGARVGYKGIGLFATYNLSSLWEGQNGPANVRALQAGIYFFEGTRAKARVKKTRLTATSL